MTTKVNLVRPSVAGGEEDFEGRNDAAVELQGSEGVGRKVGRRRRVTCDKNRLDAFHEPSREPRVGELFSVGVGGAILSALPLNTKLGVLEVSGVWREKPGQITGPAILEVSRSRTRSRRRTRTSRRKG